MAETGGPVFEGSSARPEQMMSNPAVERVQQAVDNVVNKAEITNEPQSVYEAHMQAWQKIVDEIPPEQRNSINVKLEEFWRKSLGRVDDVTVRVIDYCKDHDPRTLVINRMVSKKGVELPKKQVEKKRIAKITAKGDEKAKRLKLYEQRRAVFKQLPGGKVLDIMDKIIGPKLSKI